MSEINVDAMQAMQAERDALAAELAEMKRMTGIALMCNHVARMERAEAKLAELVEPLIAPAANESVNQRLLEAQRLCRDEVIRLAREAGFTRSNPHCELIVVHSNGSWVGIDNELQRFAHHVIADFLQRTGQYVTNDASREAAIKEAAAPWKDAVIDQLVAAHIFTAEHENDPRKAIQDLLAYHSDVAVDPRVSEAAARLVEQGRAEEREAWHDLTCVIQWLEAGCDPKEAAKELRLLQEKIRSRGEKP